MRAGPRQGISHVPEATASALVQELSLAYYDMFAVVSSTFKTVRRCVCVANGVNQSLKLISPEEENQHCMGSVLRIHSALFICGGTSSP